MAEHNLEDKIEAGFRGVNARLDTLDKGFNGVNARLDTLDKGFAGLRADFGELRADFGELREHFFEVRDALFADNVKTRDFVSIKVESLHTQMNVYADGVIAHTGKLEDHECAASTTFAG